MKKAMNAWCVGPDFTMEETFASIKAAGFDGVELNVDSEGKSPHSLGMKTTADDYAKIRDLSKKYDLKVCSVASALWIPKMSDEALWPDAEALLYKQLEAAEALGADGILVVPGGKNDMPSLLKARNASMDFLKAQRDYIEKKGIFVGVENVPTGFLTSPFDMAAFVDEIGSPKIGVYYDVGNMMPFTHSHHWIEVLGERIGKVHLKDYKRAGGLNSGGQSVDITEGDVEWDKVMPALREAGYDGYLVTETFKKDENMSYTDYINKVSKCVDKALEY